MKRTEKKQARVMVGYMGRYVKKWVI